MIFSVFATVFSVLFPFPSPASVLSLWKGFEPILYLVSAALAGTFTALLWIQKSDFLSMFFSILRGLVYRSLGKSLDDKMSLFLVISLIPALGTLFFAPTTPLSTLLPHWGTFLAFALPSLLLLRFRKWFKQNKFLPSWTWQEALLIGLLSALSLWLDYPFWILAFIFVGFRGFTKDGGYRFALYHWTIVGIANWFLKNQEPFSQAVEDNLITTLLAYIGAFALTLYLFRSTKERIPQIEVYWFALPLAMFYLGQFLLQLI